MNGILYENFNNKIINVPFLHSTYKFFSNELCDKLIENILEIKDMLKSDINLNQSRFKINLIGNTIDGFNKNIFLEKIKNIEPLNTIVMEYEKTIPTLLYNKYNNIKKENISYCLMIVYDIENYEIGPHTDSYVRNSTMVTYLGKSNPEYNIGLKIYRDNINRHEKEWKKIHYNFENFTELKEIQYYPGSSIDFKVSKNSFHGVPKIENKCDRYSLQFFIFN
jgi:hypothetical protein